MRGWWAVALLLSVACGRDGEVSLVGTYAGSPLRMSVRRVEGSEGGGVSVRIRGDRLTYGPLPVVKAEEVCVENLGPYPGVRLALRTRAEREGWEPQRYVREYLSRIPDSLKTIHDYATLLRLHLRRGDTLGARAVMDTLESLSSPRSIALDLLTWGERPDTLSVLLGPTYRYRLEYYRATGNWSGIVSLLRPAFSLDPSLLGLHLYDFAWASLYSGDTSSFLKAMGYVWAIYGDTSALRTLEVFGGDVPVIYPKVPNLLVRTLSGDTVRLDALRGKVVLLVFWSSTCSVCREQIPALSSLFERLRDRPFTLLAVSEEPPERLRDLSLPYLVVPNGGYVFSAFSILGVPSYVLVSPTGRVVRRWIGKGVAVEDLERAIGSLLPGGGP